jgi:diguanylate cyclase (GGDEF)-like protein
MFESDFANMLRRLLEESTFQGDRFSEAMAEFEDKFGESVYCHALFQLTRMAFSKDEARLHLHNILNHHAEMSEALGRTVGLRTAVCDYFLSREKMFKEPVVVETRVLVQSEEFAHIDELTGLHNRRFLNTQLSKELDRSRRNKTPFSLLLIDVDFFKRYNDTYGHLAGDCALRHVATQLRKAARNMDHVTRYGGEEFVVMLPQTSKDEAFQVAERHRLAVAGANFEHGSLTVSIGVSTFPDDADHEADLIFRADFALYEAKRSGRNKVCSKVPDKRGTVRYDLNLPVECRRVGAPANGYKGRTINLSISGMLYEVGSPLLPGIKFETRLMDAENKRTLPLQAVPIRVDKSEDGEAFHVAMKFECDSPEDKELRTLINKKLGFRA